MNVLSLVESRAYKECFILLRTVLEKFLFFWLMLAGNKFRWTDTYTIYPTISKTKREARDTTFDLWKNLNKSGDKRFQYVTMMQKTKAEDTIVVNSEYEGYFEDTDVDKSGEIMPIYNFMLEDYRPEWAHLYDIISITECHISPDILNRQGKLQKFVYHNFFHIDGILRNLLLCKLINIPQENMLRIHYNFLSKFVHSSMSNLDIYQTIRDSSSFQQKKAETMKELILLYVIKLLSLYVQVFVTAYKTQSNRLKCLKYEKITGELKELSDKLWFFEENPPAADIELSNITKRQLDDRKVAIPEGTIPWNDPLERLEYLKNKSYA
jgi:hypothetical protein